MGHVGALWVSPLPPNGQQTTELNFQEAKQCGNFWQNDSKMIAFFAPGCKRLWPAGNSALERAGVL
jgi:hypothetical protein